jgi:GNAT superfamily N-acetyltransferase
VREPLGNLAEEIFDPDRHDRDSFDCGKPEINTYLRRCAIQQSKRGMTTVRVVVDRQNPSLVLGYYCLSAVQIGGSEVDEAIRKSLSRIPVPCFRMGRLATSLAWRGRGLGHALVGLAVARCLVAAKRVAASALIVDAEDETAKRFYQHFGFTPCVRAPMHLYLPLGTQ